jgi:hypothetical protein
LVCNEVLAQCIAANATSATLQQGCKDENVCGTLDASDVKAGAGAKSTSSAAASSTTMSSSTSATASATSATAAATSSSAAMAIAIGQDYGFGIVAAGLMGAFGYML